MKKIMLAIMLMASLCYSDVYRVNVTRRDNNLYQIDGTRIYLLTMMCMELALSDEAILDTDGMRLYFVDSNSSCEIERILR